MTEFNIFDDSPAEPKLPAGQEKEIDMSVIDLGSAEEFDGKLVKASVDLPEVVPVGVLIKTSQIHLSEWVGQRKFSAALQKLLTVSDLIELQKIKESKEYKGLQVIGQDGKLLTVRTFEDLCSSIGASEAHISEQLLNLRSFGPEFLEFAEQSIGYRGLRSLRKLPDDEKVALIEAAKSGDKEQLVDLAELLIEKHIKEKAALTTQAADLTEELKFVERRANNMNAEIERLELVNERLGKKKERLTKFEEHTEAVRDECMHLQAGCELHLNSLQQLFEQVVNDAPTAEQGLRIEQIYVAASVAASHAFSMLEAMRALIPDGCPQRVQGQHILTPAEAERWLLDSQMLASTHAAEKLARELKREAKQDADKPKGRGRPAGATNKAKQ